MESLEMRKEARKAARETAAEHEALSEQGRAVLKDITAVERDGTIVKAGPHAASKGSKGAGKAEPLDPPPAPPVAPPPVAAGAPAPKFPG